MCPKCQRTLRARERTGYRCSFCRTRFALDPRTNALRLNEPKLRRVLDRLTDYGRVPCTVTQLWYALAARQPYLWELGKQAPSSWDRGLREPRRPRAGQRTDAAAYAPPFAVAAVVVFAGAVMAGRAEWGIAFAGLTLLVAAGAVTGSRLRGVRAPRHPPVNLYKRSPRPANLMRVSLADFRWQVIGRWREAYGELPGPLIDDRTYPRTIAPGRPRLALYCEDTAVATLLAAQGVHRRHRLVLARGREDVPAGIPLAVLHDASVAGCQLADGLRAAFPGRVVFDAGLSPRVVLAHARRHQSRGRPVIQQTDPPSQTQRQRLRALGTLAQEEYAWLARGWWAPLAAVRPRPLLAAVERAIEATLAAERTRREAEPAGFLTLP